MTTEGRSLAALREQLKGLEREFKDFDRGLRESVSEFRAKLDRQRADFTDVLEEREGEFLQQIEHRLEHWRRNQRAVFLLLDSEIVEMQKAAAATAPTTDKK
jgi:hypothetical protein